MIAACTAALLSGVGLAQAMSGWLAVRRFMRHARQSELRDPQPITVLKPLHGDEPLLEQALESVCVQDYPAAWQVVFGVSRPDDAALPVVQRLRSRFPGRDLAVVVDETIHGPNRKVGNLINMLSAAKHDVLVIADSDVHVAPDWLRQLAGALAHPGVGLVTTIYTGLPASGVATLGAAQINHYFLPGALLARSLGRQDCLGATMALTRETLARVGGLASLVDHLADDNVLGRLVQRLGLKVVLADTVPTTTVSEATSRRCGGTNCAGPARSVLWSRRNSPPRYCNIRSPGRCWRSCWPAGRHGRSHGSPRPGLGAGRACHDRALRPGPNHAGRVLPSGRRSGFCRSASLCRSA